MPGTVADMFFRALRAYPDRPFVRWIDGDSAQELTYAEGARVAAGVVEALRSGGIGRGDRVVVATEDLRPSLLFEVGCAIAGVVHVPAIPATPATVERLVRRVEAGAVFAAGEEAVQLIAEGFEPLCLDPIEGTVVIRPLAGPAERIEEMLLSAAQGLGEGDLYMLQPTSGTTSEPKLVMREHRAFARVARLLSFDLEAASGERFLMVAALTHGMGQYLLSAGLHLAATFSIPREIDTSSSLDEVRRLDPTYIGVTPRVLRSYVSQMGGTDRGARIFGPGAKLLLIGGSKVDDELLNHLESQGVRVAEGYGASEFSLVAVAAPGTWRPGVVGRILPDVTLKTGADGELLAKTPVMMRGYYGDPDLTAAAFDEDGFYRTGDKCELTPSGELVYLGRTRDVFNVHGGVNVSPQLAEHELERLPWVEQALLLGEQRPFVGALLAVASGCASSAAEWEALRRLAEIDVGRINERLDPAARIRAVRLLDRPFAPEVYRVVAHGKVSRKRAAAVTVYAREVASVFDLDRDAVAIPGAEAERRRGLRSALSWLVRFRQGERVIFGYTRDVSRSGVLVEAVNDVVAGAAGDVTLLSGGKEISLRSRVARRSDAAFALEFEDLRAGRAALTALLPR